jgi:hypothetical protein
MSPFFSDYRIISSGDSMSEKVHTKTFRILRRTIVPPYPIIFAKKKTPGKKGARHENPENRLSVNYSFQKGNSCGKGTGKCKEEVREKGKRENI